MSINELESEWLSGNLGNNLPSNAYDAVQYPEKAYNLGVALGYTAVGLLNDIRVIAAAVNPIPGFNPSAITITIRVNFPDGSKSLYTYNPVTKVYERVKGESRDSNGNRIPETPQDVSGGVGSSIQYDFTGNDGNLADFLIRMSMLGVPITGPMSDQMVCTTTVEGGNTVVRCKFI